MGLIRELQAAIKEGLDELLSQGVSRDEVDELSTLMENDLTEARTERDVLAQEERRLRGRIDQERRDAQALRDQAKAAVDRGDDDTGRDFIRRHRKALRAVEILEDQWAEHQALMQDLDAHIDQLDDRLQELTLRRDYLRTRQRVQALKERYERYVREFGLDEPLLQDAGVDTEALSREIDDMPREPVEPRAPRRRSRLTPEAEHAAPPEPLGLHGEMPRADVDDDEPLRRREPDLADGDEEPAEPSEAAEEAEDAWDRAPRNFRLERERRLRDIERRHRSRDFDADIERELRQLKGEPLDPPTAAAADGDQRADDQAAEDDAERRAIEPAEPVTPDGESYDHDADSDSG